MNSINPFVIKTRNPLEKALEKLRVKKESEDNENLFYYIMVDPDKERVCKVGITKNPNQRLRAYRTAAPSCYFRKVYPNFKRSHERKILNVLKNIAVVKSELVYFDPGLVQNIVEAYFDDNQINYE